MKHFLLTRWNLPGAFGEPSPNRVSDPGWRARRKELFESYCLPSVARQTADDFTWLFLVSDQLTPEADRAWFSGQDHRLRVLSVADAGSTGAAEARDAVVNSLSGDAWVITTRLDSDDVLHPDHLRSVRVEHDGGRRVVEFLDGFYYDVLRDELRRVREPENAFVSVLEPAAVARTALAWSHREIAREHEILYLERPGWIAVVHDRNTSTYLWGDPVRASAKRDVLREFGVPRPPYLLSRLRRARTFPRRLRARVRRAYFGT
jgi:Putative rhamnosyl transferase